MTGENYLYKYRNKIIISKNSGKLCCYINGFATRDHLNQRHSNNNHFIDEHLKNNINNYNTKILLNIKLHYEHIFNIFTLTQKKIMNFFSIYFINNDISKIRLLLKNKYNIINNDNAYNYLLNYNHIYENIYNNVNNDNIKSNTYEFFMNKNSTYYGNPNNINTPDNIIKLREILTSRNLISFNFDNRFDSSNYFKLPILKTHKDYYNNADAIKAAIDTAAVAATIVPGAAADAYVNAINNVVNIANNITHSIIYTGTNLNNNFQNNLFIKLSGGFKDTTISSDLDILTNVNDNSLCLYTRPIDNDNNYLRFKYRYNTVNVIDIDFDMNFSIINTGYNENKIYFKKTDYTDISKNTLYITGKLLKKNDYTFMKQNKKKIFLSLGNGICGINSISLCNNLHLGSTNGARNNQEKKFIFTDVIKLFNPNFLVNLDFNLDFNFQLNHNEYYVNNFYYNKFNEFFKQKSDNLNKYYDISYTPLLSNDYTIINSTRGSINYKKNNVNFLYSDEIRYKINIIDNKFNYDFKFNYNKLIDFDLNVGVNISTYEFPYNFDIVNRIKILTGSDFRNVNCVFLYNDINQGPEYQYPYNNIDICNNPSIDTISKAILNFKFNDDRNLKNYSIIPYLNNNNLTKKQIYSYIVTNNIPKLLSIIPKDNESFTVGRDEGLNLRSDEPLICKNDELSQRKKFKAIFENKYNQNNKVNNNNLNKRNFAKIVRSSNTVRKKLLSCNDF